jgi:uncharacterized membrane protein YeaQ/YmgE (transglycosylase-associated protein family)
VIVLVWAVLGALLGWLANTVIRTADLRGRVLNIVIGAVGAVCGRLLIDPTGQVWTLSPDVFSVSAILGSSLGAVISLVVARLARVTG